MIPTTQWRATLAVLCVALALAAPATPAPAHAARAATPCVSTGTFPYLHTLHTCGPYIEDAQGQPAPLQGVNWYGFESNDFVAAGLDRQPYRAIVDFVKQQGYNTLRIPFSNEMVEKNPVVSTLTQTCPQGAPATACRAINGQGLLAANPDLQGLTALQILKAIVDYAGSQGLYVFLDDHRSRAGWGAQENGLWYDSANGYPAAGWLSDWQTVAQMFGGDPALTGVDLFNEPHSVGTPTTCADYVSGHGASWGACGGQENPATDWRSAATAAGNALLAIDPNLLVVVEGTSVAPDSSGRLDITSGGTNLEAAGGQPVQLSRPGRLVYSVHGYYWSQPFGDTASMVARWSHLFGYLTNPAAPYVAPVWVGEFGTCNGGQSCFFPPTALRDPAARQGNFGSWFDSFLQYLNTPPYSDAPPFGWAFWPLNGTTPDAYDFTKNRWDRGTGNAEQYGLLNTAWTDLSYPDLQGELFSGVQLPLTPAPTETATATPTDAPTGTPTSITVTATAMATPTATATARPVPSRPVTPLRVSAAGLLAQGRVTFDLVARRDRNAHLSGTFPYADHVHHLAVQASHIDGLSLSCAPPQRVKVTGMAHDGRGRHYRFAVWVALTRSGRITFTLHLSNGFLISGQAHGRVAFSCPLAHKPQARRP